jgi:hypothetical protein
LTYSWTVLYNNLSIIIKKMNYMSETPTNPENTNEKLPIEETKFGTFAPTLEDGLFTVETEPGKVLQNSGNLDALRYHWCAYQNDPINGISGAHGSMERLEQAMEAAESDQECPVSPDPREEAKEWGIKLPY